MWLSICLFGEIHCEILLLMVFTYINPSSLIAGHLWSLFRICYSRVGIMYDTSVSAECRRDLSLVILKEWCLRSLRWSFWALFGSLSVSHFSRWAPPTPHPYLCSSISMYSAAVIWLYVGLYLSYVSLRDLDLLSPSCLCYHEEFVHSRLSLKWKLSGTFLSLQTQG